MRSTVIDAKLAAGADDGTLQEAAETFHVLTDALLRYFSLQRA